MRIIECDTVCFPAAAAAFTRSTTASTPIPCVASSTNRLRWAASPPISSSRVSVSGRSAPTIREMRLCSASVSDGDVVPLSVFSSFAICSM